jgi:hypothetical protein
MGQSGLCRSAGFYSPDRTIDGPVLVCHTGLITSKGELSVHYYCLQSS